MHAAQILTDEGMLDVLEPWFYETVQQHLYSRIAPQFWSKFQDPVPSSGLVQYLKESFDGLHSQLSMFWPCIEKLYRIQRHFSEQDSQRHPVLPIIKQRTREEKARETLVLYFKAIVFATCTRHFHEAISSFYFMAFKAFDSSICSKKGMCSYYIDWSDQGE